jgi:hypothetical protein
VSLFLWWHFSFSRLAFLHLTVDRHKALQIAREYLKEQNYDLRPYTSAVIFEMDEDGDLYLQKTIGFDQLKEFVKRESFDMFYWKARFFKEGEQEEFHVFVSAATGEIIGFKHILEETAARQRIERDEAKEKGIAFLKSRFNFQPDLYTMKSDLQTTRDFRDDHSLSWQKNDVKIPWTDKPENGTAKLVMNVIVSGDEILGFTKNELKIPDEFEWNLQKSRVVGQNIFEVVRTIYYALLSASVFFIFLRRNHISMHLTKKFYVSAIVLIFSLSVLMMFNLFPHFLYTFSTSTSFQASLFQTSLNHLMYSVFIAIAALVPGLAGETIHFELSRHKPQGSFLHYLRSTFLSREVAQQILVGYLLCAILLGVQSFILEVGQKYFGVWVERNWMAELSTMYLPFLAALTIGFKASFDEEIMFRFFAINLGTKLFKSVSWAILISSLIWGFGHSNYPIFPMWFRGIEVSCLGILLGISYYYFGIIPVIVGHYLLDVFWNTAGYLFGQTTPFYFWSSLVVLALPAVFAFIAFAVNKQAVLKELKWHLTNHQLFNLKVLKSFLKEQPQMLKRSNDELVKEIVSHGWDPAVVETAANELKNDDKA